MSTSSLAKDSPYLNLRDQSSHEILRKQMSIKPSASLMKDHVSFPSIDEMSSKKPHISKNESLRVKQELDQLEKRRKKSSKNKRDKSDKLGKQSVKIKSRSELDEIASLDSDFFNDTEDQEDFGNKDNLDDIDSLISGVSEKSEAEMTKLNLNLDRWDDQKYKYPDSEYIASISIMNEFAEGVGLSAVRRRSQEDKTKELRKATARSMGSLGKRKNQFTRTSLISPTTVESSVFKSQEVLPYEKTGKRQSSKSIFGAGRVISDTTLQEFLYSATEKEPQAHRVYERIRVSAPRKWETVVPLATPRHKPVALCEICSSRARVMCSHCRVTFYCNKEHFEADEFHPRCCFLLQVVRTPPKIYPTRWERDRQRADLIHRKNELVNRVTTVGILSLSTEKFEVANASFNQAICYGKTLLGEHSLYVAKLFILKAECSLQLGSVIDAEKEMAAGEIVYGEHLTDVDFAEATTDHKLTDISAQLAMVQSMVHMARRQWELALFYISESIYQYSRMYGPDSLKSARCYFLMGEIFFRKRKFDVSEALYVHSLQNYLDWLVVVVEDHYMSNKQQTIFDRLVTSQHEHPDLIKDIDLPMQIEGEIIIHLKRLHQIFRNRKDFAYGKCLAAFTMLAFIRGMVKFSEKFASISMEYMDAKKDSQLKAVILMIQRRTRRMIPLLIKAKSRWSFQKSKGKPGRAQN